MSQDELVDIVDEDGNFIKVVSKREAHEKGLLHKTSLGILINSKGEWLLVTQSSSKQDPGKYVFPVGGHVSAGESEVEALKKEAREEIGLNKEFEYELIGRKIYNRFVLGRKENHIFVVYKIFSDEKPIPNEEINTCHYFPESEVKKMYKESPDLFGGGFHFIVENFLSNLN